MTFKNTKSEVKFVPKGWGFEKWVDNRAEYCGKLLYFVKGRKCSLHYHKLKTETFYVHQGKIMVLWSDEVKKLETIKDDIGLDPVRRLFGIPPWHEEYCEKTILTQGDTFFVPPGRLHQMIALEDTELFEFSSQHFEEDSYRIVKGD
ncbi:MAG: cupin domain-containing protein [Candidatus Parcubacteria bacterium]|nr:cupin domain-containing protein [Candidatus Parcubacteria bacterium]